MATDELELLTRTAEEMLGAVRDQSAGDTLAESAAGWKLLAQQGMTRVSVPQPGGAGEPLPFLAGLLKAAGRTALSVPLVDTHVGVSLLCAAGFPDACGDPETGAACAVGVDPRLLCPSAPAPARLTIVHPGLAETVLALVPHGDAAHVAAWRWSDLKVEVSRNTAGEPVATVESAELPRPSWSAEIALGMARDAALVDLLGRSVMIAGAAERALEQTLGYTREREQFGRPLAAFQSVQQTVAQMAGLVTAASLSAEAAMAALASRTGDGGSDGEDDVVAVLACRIQCSRTAAFVARAAHQLHGAIGFTQEHSLRFATTRLTAWRAHGPTVAEVSEELGRRAVAVPELWSLVAGANA